MGKITRRQPLPWHKDDTEKEVSMAEADEVIDMPVNATQTSHEEFSQDIERNAECTSYLEIRCAIGIEIYQKKKPVQAESTRKQFQNLGSGGDGNAQISFGTAPPNSSQQAEEQFLSKVFLWVAIIFILWLLLA